MAALGELESAVMGLLWDADRPLSVREVLNELLAERTLAYTTVLTVMDRLYKKRHLTREPDGNAFRYTPAATRAEYTAALMAGALDANPDRVAALVHFTSQISTEDAAALRAALGLARHARSRGMTAAPARPR